MEERHVLARNCLHHSLAICAAALLTSCGKNQEAQPESSEVGLQQFNFADWVLPDITSLDPYASEFLSFQHYLFEPLVRQSLESRAISMQAASSYKVSDDGRTYTFTLRPGATWHDGRAVQAGDFRDGFRRSMGSGVCTSYFSKLGFLNADEIIRGEKPVDTLGVEAPDATHFVIRLSEPSDFLIPSLSLHCFFPVRLDVVEREGERYGLEPGRFVGNGPYRVTEWTQGTSALLEKASGYWDAANISSRRIKLGSLQSFGCADSEALCYKEGKISWASLYRTGDYALAKQLGLPIRAPSAPRPTSWTRTIDINVREGALFSDPRLRKALAIGINRKAVARDMDMGGGDGFPFYGIVSDAIPGVAAGSTFRQEHPLPQIDAKLAEAHALVAEFLAERNLSALPAVRMLFFADWQGYAEPIVSAVSTALGTPIEALYLPGSECVETMKSGQAELFWGAQVPAEYDPSGYLDIFRSAEPVWNMAGFRDPAFDELVARAQASRTLAERHRLSAEAEALLLSRNVTVPVYIDKHYVIEEFEGVESFPFGAGPDFSRVKPLRE